MKAVLLSMCRLKAIQQHDKSDQIVSLSFQQWCHADSRKTGQDKNDYIYICRMKCCTQKLEYALKKKKKKIIPTVVKCLKYRWFSSKTTENVASSTCCNSVLRDSRRGPDRRQCSDTALHFSDSISESWASTYTMSSYTKLSDSSGIKQTLYFHIRVVDI